MGALIPSFGPVRLGRSRLVTLPRCCPRSARRSDSLRGLVSGVREGEPDGFEFCGFCRSPLAVTPPPAREERKVVTVFFCDLVGFTAKAEQLDPEDVRAVLGPYHSRLRTELERHGGTVEKFIG